MKLIPDIVRDRFFLTGKRLDQLVQQGVKNFREAASYSDPDEDLYRPLTQDTTRDLNPIKHTRHIDLCYKLWLQNPLAKQLIRHMKNFCIGGGVQVQAKEQETVQKLIDRFWSDPKNLMDLKLPGYVEALGIFGEQCYAVNKFSDGAIRLGYIDPKNITGIRMNALNYTEPVEINVPDGDGKERWLKVITTDEDPKSPTYGLLVGDVFYFQINKAPNSTRGYSDLLALADWLDGYDQYLFSMVDRSILMNAFLYDVTIEGATEKEIKDYNNKNPGSPKPGSVRFHNEKVKWEAVTPDLKSGDVEALGKVFRTQIIGGMGYPLHFFGDGSDANLATAAEMGWPTLKMFEERQRYIKYMLEQIISYILQEGLGVGSQKIKAKNIDKTFTITFPELSRKDITKTSTAFTTLVTAVSTAISQGVLSKETGMQIVANSAALIGVEIDPKEELDKIAQTKVEEDGKDYLDLEKTKPNSGGKTP